MSRTVLITGGAGGMGQAIRERFLAAGDAVVGADLHDTDVIGDVMSVSDCERMIAETVALHRQLDVLVCAAGVWTEGPTADTTEKQWDQTIDTNLKGTFFALRSPMRASPSSGA